MQKQEYQLFISQATRAEVVIRCADGESVLVAMQRQGIWYPSDCGGRGTCGKCKLQVTEGDLPITDHDRRLFSEEELHQGYRLSCKAYPKENCRITLLSVTEASMEVLTESRIAYKSDTILEADRTINNAKEYQNYAIAIDLGTTTLAMNLIGLPEGTVLQSYAAINPQRAYGSDVISRMNASNNGRREQLRTLILNGLWEGIAYLLKELEGADYRIKDIAIAGNTTMGHLLMGYSCETLGKFPFEPVNIKAMRCKAGELFAIQSVILSEEIMASLQDVTVTLLPGISTFVGGDIVAGLAVCGFQEFRKPCLLIDFGTNGEMAIGCRDKLLVTSTAAGPAFEGGNISCGVGSIPGAISHFTIEDRKASFETIGGQTPVGVCGTGVMEIVSELYKEGLIDTTGLLQQEYFDTGYPVHDNIRFTQKDIRELQLAKAAVRAGIEVLAKCYEITLQELDRVYLAGGFGFRMNVDKAIGIGLLPEELRNKITVIGNSSLAGAAAYLTEKGMEDRLNQVISIASEIHLSNEEDFNELYLQYMYF